MAAYSVSTAALGAVLAAQWAMSARDSTGGAALAVLGALALAMWCAACGSVDLREYRLPDRLTITGAAVILPAAAGAGHGRAALLGAALLAGLYLVLRLASPQAMGAGDMKLAVGLGAVTACGGGACWLLAAVGAPVLTAAGGMCAGMLRRRGGPGAPARAGVRAGGAQIVPHGAAMCLASLLALAAAG